MDRYTKTVLTIIAIALSVIAIENVKIQASAADSRAVWVCKQPEATNSNENCARVTKGGYLQVDVHQPR